MPIPRTLCPSSLSTLFDQLSGFRNVPIQLNNLLGRLAEQVVRLENVAVALKSIYEPRPYREGFVLILTPEPRVYSLAVRAPQGTRVDVWTQADLPIPKGSWIVFVGPGVIVGARVGNLSQTAHADFQGPACITSEECSLGTRLGVSVELR